MSVKSFSKKLLTIIGSVSIVACGSSDELNETASSGSSSSSVAAVDISYIYPIQNSNVFGLDGFDIYLNVNSQDIASIDIGGVSMVMQSGNTWKTLSEISLSDQISIQLTPVIRFNDGSEVSANTLNIINDQLASAGKGDRSSFDDIVFSDDGKSLFMSSSLDGKLLSMLLLEGETVTLFTGESPGIGSFWPIDFDSESNKIITMSSGRNEAPKLNTFSLNGTLESAVAIPAVTAPLGVHIDEQGSFPFSFNSKAVYILDDASLWPLQSHYLTGDMQGMTSEVVYEEGDNGSFTFDDDREDAIYDSINNRYLLLRGSSPALLSLSARVGVAGARGNTSLVSDLTYMGLSIESPTAMALSKDAAIVYIVEDNRVWSLELETGVITLISSSSLFPSMMGKGPSIGSSVNDVEIHPTADILYIVTSSGALMAIDPATGNRIIVSN